MSDDKYPKYPTQPTPEDGDENCAPEEAPLSDTGKARIRENIALIHRYMPEVVAQIHNLHQQGLITGWRNLSKVEVFLVEEENA